LVISPTYTGVGGNGNELKLGTHERSGVDLAQTDQHEHMASSVECNSLTQM